MTKYGIWYPPRREDGSEIDKSPWAMKEDLSGPILFDFPEQAMEYEGKFLPPKYALDHRISPEVREYTSE
jgi:hypothetical protein